MAVALLIGHVGQGGYAVWRLEGGPQSTVRLVVLDTVRLDAFGCYGAGHNPTPHIDALAADGVRFDMAISTSGWTLPSIGSLMTATWPTIHGGLGQGERLSPLRAEVPSVTEILKANGYDTFGFANAAFVSPMLGFDRGFDVFDHRHAYNWQIRRADETVHSALNAIRGLQSKRSFVFLHIFDAHLDYDPPPGYASKYTKGRTEPQPPLSWDKCMGLRTDDGRAPPAPEDVAYVKGVYEGEVNFTDAQMGLLVKELKTLGLYDKTMLIVVSDHGEEFWEHRRFEHGHTLYDELIRIPLILKLPAALEPVRRTVEDQVRILDVAPTILDILGIEPPESFAGRSLMPLIAGQIDEERMAFSESTLHRANKLALRGKGYKYVLDLKPNARVPEELYDYRADPGETENLLAALPDVAMELRTQLLEFHDSLSDQAETMSHPEVMDMTPNTIERLKSLGYIR